MSEQTYEVHVVHYWTYSVDAESPEDAVQAIEDGDLPTGECTGYSIASVTLPDDYLGDDLRAPVPCRGGCGRLLPASGNDECTKCLLQRIEAQQSQRSAVPS